MNANPAKGNCHYEEDHKAAHIRPLASLVYLTNCLLLTGPSI